jgi:hypothetical protein
MAPKEPKIGKQVAPGTTRHITFTIPETLETIWEHESTTKQSVIMAVYRVAEKSPYTQTICTSDSI